MENILSLKIEKNKTKVIPKKSNYTKLANNTINKNPLKINEKIHKNQDNNNKNQISVDNAKENENEKTPNSNNIHNNNNDSINNCNISFENIELDTITKNSNNENNNFSNNNNNHNNNYKNSFNALLKEANQLKNEYIQQRSSVEDIFELDEILLKNEDLLEIYDFGDRQHNLIDVNIFIKFITYKLTLNISYNNIN
jgi:hypothetical protein